MMNVHNIKNEYISYFNELNKSNIKYSSLAFKSYNGDVDLEGININYSQIQNFILETKKISFGNSLILYIILII